MVKKILKLDDYYQVARESFKKIWQNKMIWFWGLFLPSGIYLNFSGNHKEDQKTLDQGFVGDFLSNYWGWVVFGVLTLLILGLVAWIVSAIARSGVIKEFDAKQNKEKHKLTFKGVWKIGKKDFKKILGLDLWLLGIVLGVLIFDLVLLLLAFMTDSTALAIFIAVFLGLATVLLLIVLAILKPIATILLVLADLTIKNSFLKSWNLLKSNLKEYLKLILTLFVISVIGGAVVTLLLLIGGALLAGLFGAGGGFSNSSGEIPALVIFVMIILGGVLLLGVLAVEAFLNLWKMDISIWWVKIMKAVKADEKKIATKRKKVAKKVSKTKTKKVATGAKA